MKFLSKTTHDAFRGVRSIAQDFTFKSKCVFGAFDGQYCIDYLLFDRIPLDSFIGLISF